MDMSDSFSEIFHTTFIGEQVEFLTSIPQHWSENTEDGVISGTIPMIVQGYVLDIDDEYYYVGDTPHEVSRAVKRSEVLFIEIVSEKKVFDKILDQFPVPDNESEEN